MTSLVMSIDDRIVAAAPSCFITSIRHVYAAKGPQDPEQVIFGQLPIGLNHASFVLAGGNAVRIHAVHEDFFPFAGTLRTYDTVRRVVENCSLDETTYALTDVFGRHNWPESSRQSTANWMKRFLLGDKSVGDVNVEKLRRIDESFNFADHDCGLDRAQCNVTSSGDISKEPGFRSVFEILYDEYLKSRRNATPLKGAELKKTADRLAGIVQPENSGFTVIEKSSFKTNGCLVAKLSFENAEGVKLPAVLIRPPKEVSAPVVFAGAKTRGSFAKEISAALAEGRCVLSVDLFGIGEIGTPKVPYFASKIGRGPEEGVAAHLYAFGESLIGYWASEMLFAGDYLKKLTGKVPRVHSVGTGVIAAAHAYASRRDLVSAVTWSGEKPYSWESMVKVASMDCGYANTVFGALKYYDWTDLL